MMVFVSVLKRILSIGLLASTIESSRSLGPRSARQLKGDSIENDGYYFSMSYSYSYSYDQGSYDKMTVTEKPTPTSTDDPTQKMVPDRTSTPEPTLDPSKGLTKVPSKTPTDNSINGQTSSSENLPHLFKKIVKCQEDEDLNDVGSLGTFETPISFYYDIQTNVDFDSGSSDWIEALENLLLQVLGEKLLNCDNDKLVFFGVNGRKRLLQDDLKITSVDASPRDRPTLDKCTVSNSEATSCTRMSGGITITGVGKTTEGEEAALTYVQNYMKTSLSGDDLNVTGIVQIDYVGKDSAPPIVRKDFNIADPSNGNPGSGGGISFLIGSVCAILALITLLSVRCIKKRARNEIENSDDMKNVDDGTVNSEKDQKSTCSLEFEGEKYEKNLNIIPESVTDV